MNILFKYNNTNYHYVIITVCIYLYLGSSSGFHKLGI